MNEESLIALFNRHGVPIPSGCLGPGDDAAVLTLGKQSLVITTDLLAEGVHFLRDKTSAADLGHKALAVNLSDIAAMGATPVGYFLSIAIPTAFSYQWVEEFSNGMQSLARQYDCPLLGGDTTRAQDELTINITALGSVETSLLKLRSLARPGDILAVTGTLGNAAMGLMSLTDSWNSELEKFQNRPTPRIEEGSWLAQFEYVHAMMDISDGLGQDVPKLCQASGLGAQVEVQQVPVDQRMRALCHQHNMEAKAVAVSGGEDYELLVAIDPIHFRQLAQAFESNFHRPLSNIGTLTQDQQVRWFSGEQEWAAPPTGFSHF